MVSFDFEGSSQGSSLHACRPKNVFRWHKLIPDEHTFLRNRCYSSLQPNFDTHRFEICLCSLPHLRRHAAQEVFTAIDQDHPRRGGINMPEFTRQGLGGCLYN